MSKAIIIGATSAIAAETAKLMAARGDELLLVGRNANRLSSIESDLRVRGARKVSTLCIDLNELNRHYEIVKKAQETFDRTDTVLIAHGSLGDQKAGEADFSSALQELQTNFVSVASLVTVFANYFENQGKGCLAVVSSVAGDRGRQSNYIYGTAKGAVNLFLQGVRNRLFSKGVNVLTIKPGFVDTPMTAYFKKGMLFVKPERVAKGILKAIDQRKDVVYLPCFWWAIMAVIKLIPEKVFKRLKL